VRALGLRAAGGMRAIAVGLLGYAVALPAIVGLLLVSSWLWPLVGVAPAEQDVVDIARTLEGPAFWAFAGAAVLVIPLCEELMFRAFLQPLLVQNLGDRGGVAMTALLFAGIHGNAFVLLPMFALSLVLGAVMLRTQRIAACFVVHALHNGATLVLLRCVPQSGEWLSP
jgi:hypothetical protein